MLSHPAAIPLSTRSLNHLACLVRAHRNQRRSRSRCLDPGRQAVLALAHLRNGDILTRLAGGFEIGVATGRRYVREAIDLLAATADDLETAKPDPAARLRDLRRHTDPDRAGCRPEAVLLRQTPPPRRDEGQSGSRSNPCHRRTSQGRPQDLETPDQLRCSPPPGDLNRASRPHPAPRREPRPTQDEKARSSSGRWQEQWCFWFLGRAERRKWWLRRKGLGFVRPERCVGDVLVVEGVTMGEFGFAGVGCISTTRFWCRCRTGCPSTIEGVLVQGPPRSDALDRFWRL